MENFSDHIANNAKVSYKEPKIQVTSNARMVYACILA